MTALRSTSVPVPLTYALCPDPDVLGAPFYVMSGSTGPSTGRRTSWPGSAWTGPGSSPSTWSPRWPSCTRSTRPTSAWLTSAAPRASSPGRSAGGRSSSTRPAAARWPASTSCTRGWRPARRRVAPGHRARRLPAGQRAGRGGRQGRRGSRLGDGHPGRPADRRRAADRVPADGPAGRGPDGQQRPRLPARAGDPPVVRRRERARPVRPCFYIALASFKAAVILEGIHYRYVHGQTVGSGFAEIGTLVEPLVTSGLAALQKEGN